MYPPGNVPSVWSRCWSGCSGPVVPKRTVVYIAMEQKCVCFLCKSFLIVKKMPFNCSKSETQLVVYLPSRVICDGPGVDKVVKLIGEGSVINGAYPV